jgi:putative addiction module component (TIGR02574 family)
MDVSAILSELLALDVEKKIEIMKAILDSIAIGAAPADLTEDQKRVFDRRIADLEVNPGNVLTWEEIKTRVRSQK